MRLLDIETLGGLIVYARSRCGQVERGTTAAAAQCLHALSRCDALLGDSPDHHRFYLQVAITRQATLCAKRCAWLADWPTAWRVLDMVHNIGVLADGPDQWQTGWFRDSFVARHIDFLPEPFKSKIRMLAERLK